MLIYRMDKNEHDGGDVFVIADRDLQTNAEKFVGVVDGGAPEFLTCVVRSKAALMTLEVLAAFLYKRYRNLYIDHLEGKKRTNMNDETKVMLSALETALEVINEKADARLVVDVDKVNDAGD